MAQYVIKFDKRFIKLLEKIPVQFRTKIKEAIEELKSNPRPQGFIKLKGQNNLNRIRIGDYRVVYEIHDNILIILLIIIGHRKDVYKDL